MTQSDTNYSIETLIKIEYIIFMDQKTIKQLLKEIREIRRIMVTKDDAKNFLTKEDTKNFLTKDDAKNFATKDDLKHLVTKDYLVEAFKKQREAISEDFGEVINALFEEEDKRKADRTDVEALNKRVTLIERKFAT